MPVLVRAFEARDAAEAGARAARTSWKAGECGGRTCAGTRTFSSLLVHAGGFNLGLIMRKLVGRGTPRGFQGRWAAWHAWIGSLAGLLGWLWVALEVAPGNIWRRVEEPRLASAG